MSVTAVVGAQWGDEGKGRIIDYLASDAHVVIRCQGGDNAGHTVVNDLGTFKLHLIPSGIFHPNCLCILGAGTVVNPAALLEEMAELRAAGLSLDNFRLEQRAHVLLPYHRELDGLEDERRGAASIGTTKRGIGPAYADKAARHGVRVGDLLNPAYLERRLRLTLDSRNDRLRDYGRPPLELPTLLAQAAAWADALRPYIVDSLPFVQNAVQRGHTLVLEGQLAALRDLDWGTYPYVTSSNPTAAGLCQGAGLAPRHLDEVVGVVKAYSTAVGAGPMPTELHDAAGARLRDVGQEFGASTGRPRRCGWYDAVAVGHSAWLNGFSHLAITKLDVLDGWDELKVCVAYDLDGQRVTLLPDTPAMERAVPVYETVPGWREPTVQARRWTDLPLNARHYVERLAELAQTPVRFVSVGPHRDALIVL
ncbi:MAG: adenylosuccinate synthase [Anaerolineae bacterium]|nr:adenylosuccinate synthase [Anaerolineae bacterium]